MNADTTVAPETLRAEMVATVRKAGYARLSEVERVLLDTPRHEFVPEADLGVAYDPWQAVITYRFEDGLHYTSSPATASSRAARELTTTLAFSPS